MVFGVLWRYSQVLRRSHDADNATTSETSVSSYSSNSKGAQFTTIQNVHFAKFTIMHSSAVQSTQSTWLKSPLTSVLVTTPKAVQVPRGRTVQSLSTWYSGYNRARVPFRMAANGANGRLRKHGGEKADTAARRKSRIPDRLQDTTLEEKAHKVFFGWQLKKICLGT